MKYLSTRIVFALAFTFLVAGCTASLQNRSYPPHPFYTSNVAALRTGMKADSVEILFGAPDSIYPMEFGSKTDSPWSGVAWRYYVARDTAYQYVDRWVKNVFYFRKSNGGLVLHHWIVEYPEAGTETNTGTQGEYR